ncbi:NACHT domain-containing protein [Crocosphaera sp. UHCC 0190]|uniref:NACHT domain-containing protein n=1 Tax=Crocosphaera sp. UHCC 0190 TaxID=3110246 RepID=UPI002B20887F|nr:NACHT domain-containing protein [Crocosphaera sp. UHCC 0190]MEA5509775.1 NACHT domain-containing protein [Crocosphaera sp. UHCC 0190]
MLIKWSESVKDGVEASKQIFELARVLKENKDNETFKEVVSQVSSLLDILNAPLGQVAAASLPFVSIATGIITYIVEKNQQELTLEQSIGLVAQTAYLESIQSFFRSHFDLTQTLSKDPALAATSQKIKQLGQTLNVEREEAEQALVCFHESKLAKQFNDLLQTRLEESGISENKAKIIVERISRKTHRYLKPNFAKIKDKIHKLSPIYGKNWQQELTFNYGIEKYLKEKIDQEPLGTIFAESFSFHDLYVTLKVQGVTKGIIDDNAPYENIETWAINHLLNPHQVGKVLFIQGQSGGGKSVFCRIFAGRIRQYLHPIYTPILIRLRDIKTIENNFEKTLASAIGWEFATGDHNWLTDKNTRFLFILDGLDELILESGKKDSLQVFLDQVAHFQQQCQENPEQGHRIIITGRPLSLYGIDGLMPNNLEWVNLALMDDETQSKWLEKWEQIVGLEEAQEFRQFLFNQRCPQTIKKLSREPLLLYLLGAMHRDKQVNLDNFIRGEEEQVKVNIYQKAIAWILTKQRNKNLNEQLSSLEIEDLHSVLAEAGFCVLQSGKENALIRTIEDRLLEKGDESAKELIEKARQSKEKNSLKNALAVFHFKKSTDVNNPIEFFHKSFGEFLASECLVESMEEWTQKGGSSKKTYFVKDREFRWQVYDLFGGGYLNPEVMSYLMPLLRQRNINWVTLYERLYEFYLSWSDGEFIEALDSSDDMLPLKKARQLQKYDLKRGQRQVDICTGLNVLILLLEINRYAQSNEILKDKISFYPWGNPDIKTEFDGDRLPRIMGYSECLGKDKFRIILGKFLENVNFQEINIMN